MIDGPIIGLVDVEGVPSFNEVVEEHQRAITKALGVPERMLLGRMTPNPKIEKAARRYLTNLNATMKQSKRLMRRYKARASRIQARIKRLERLNKPLRGPTRYLTYIDDFWPMPIARAHHV